MNGEVQGSNLAPSNAFCEIRTSSRIDFLVCSIKFCCEFEIGWRLKRCGEMGKKPAQDCPSPPSLNSNVALIDDRFQFKSSMNGWMDGCMGEF